MAVQTKIFRSTLQVEYFTGVIWSGMVIVSGGILFIWNGFVAVVLRPLLATDNPIVSSYSEQANKIITNNEKSNSSKQIDREARWYFVDNCFQKVTMKSLILWLFKRKYFVPLYRSNISRG